MLWGRQRFRACRRKTMEATPFNAPHSLSALAGVEAASEPGVAATRSVTRCVVWACGRRWWHSFHSFIRGVCIPRLRRPGPVGTGAASRPCPATYVEPCTLPGAYSLPRLHTHWLVPPVFVHCLLVGHAAQLPQVLSSVGDTQVLPQQILPSLQSESMLHSLHSPLTQTFLSAEQHTLLQTVRPARVNEVRQPGS